MKNMYTVSCKNEAEMLLNIILKGYFANGDSIFFVFDLPEPRVSFIKRLKSSLLTTFLPLDAILEIRCQGKKSPPQVQTAQVSPGKLEKQDPSLNLRGQFL